MKDLDQWPEELRKSMAYDALPFASLILDREMRVWGSNTSALHQIAPIAEGDVLWAQPCLSWSVSLSDRVHAWCFEARGGAVVDEIVQVLDGAGELRWARLHMSASKISAEEVLVSVQIHHSVCKPEVPGWSWFTGALTTMWGGGVVAFGDMMWVMTPKAFAHMHFFGRGWLMGVCPLGFGLLILAANAVQTLGTRHSSNGLTDGMMRRARKLGPLAAKVRVLSEAMLVSFWIIILIGFARWSWQATSPPSYTTMAAMSLASLIFDNTKTTRTR